MKQIVSFGEIMIRLDAPDNLRLRQAMPGALNTTFAGAEANVAVSIAHLGGRSRFVTALPDNSITDACVAVLKGFGVDTGSIERSAVGRFGAYFVETGANQRPSNVIYDRVGSSIALAEPEVYNWAAAFEDAQWFHVTGITPALSEAAAESAIAAARRAKEKGLTVSCDLNFRNKLWRWSAKEKPAALAERIMRKLLVNVDVLVANEEDASKVLGITVTDTDVESGRISLDGYRKAADEIASQFPGLTKIATTLRESLSATHNNWGAMLFDVERRESYFAPMHSGEYRPYEIRAIVDRVGGGDSFAAALIYALTTPDLAEPRTAVHFATAASCLAHSIRGDFNLNSRAEIEALMGGSASGRVRR